MIRQWRVGQTLALCLLCVALVPLAACTSDAPEGRAAALFEDSPRPADASTYPNLSTVPARPDDLPSPEERSRLRQALERDRDALRDAAAQ